MSGCECHGRVHDDFPFDGFQSARAGLSVSLVLSALDPADDHDAELFSGSPALAVQDLLLEYCEERFYRGVSAGGTALAHQSEGVMTVQDMHELP
ncbi:hypothetical protein [Brachybacterium endophyticum]|uniref:hypothetical protein n=1 Tax=Brachybacterium endophyticum TaxID=2182385 RepID=UPI0010583583